MSRKRKQYTGRYRYDSEDGVWLAHIEEVPEVHTYGRTLPKAEAHLRDALALWLEASEEELTILPSYDLPSDAVDAIALASRWRLQASQTDAQASRQTIRACLLLQEAGLSQRDIGGLLGLSHQRVHQLLSEWGKQGVPERVAP